MNCARCGKQTLEIQIRDGVEGCPACFWETRKMTVEEYGKTVETSREALGLPPIKQGKEGKEEREERIAAALESCAASLFILAHPVFTVPAQPCGDSGGKTESGSRRLCSLMAGHKDPHCDGFKEWPNTSPGVRMASVR